jgi:hypothetical protein
MFLCRERKCEILSSKEYCDGFAQSIKLWNQETPLLGKHVPTNAQPTIEGHPLLGNGPVKATRGNEYATIREAVFSVIRVVLVATQRALNTLQ